MLSFNCLNTFLQTIKTELLYRLLTCLSVYPAYVCGFKHGEYLTLPQTRDSISGLAVSRLCSHSDSVPFLGDMLLQATPTMIVKKVIVDPKCITFRRGFRDCHEKSHRKGIQRWSLEHHYGGSIGPL